MKLSFELPIHTFQIDFSHHVSNVVYIQWMEIARVKLTEEAGSSLAEMESGGVLPALVETHIRYIRPLVLGDTVKVEVWLSELMNASAWCEYRFYNQKGELCAEGRQKGLWIDRQTGRPARFTEEERRRYETWLIPAGDTMT